VTTDSPAVCICLYLQQQANDYSDDTSAIIKCTTLPKTGSHVLWCRVYFNAA